MWIDILYKGWFWIVFCKFLNNFKVFLVIGFIGFLIIVFEIGEVLKLGEVRVFKFCSSLFNCFCFLGIRVVGWMIILIKVCFWFVFNFE